MNDNNTMIADYMNNLKRESGIDEPDTDTTKAELNKNICEPDEVPAATSVSVSDQQHHSEPTTCESSFNNNTSVAQNILNLFSGLTRCFNKYVQIPNYPAYAYIYFDSSGNAYLYTMDLNNKFVPFANVKFENSEFVVYQNYQRIGTLYGNDNEQIWQFIPNNMPIPNQHSQCIQSSTPNNPTYNYVFNNVPCEQATEIIDSIMRNNPSNNIELNFASPTAKASPTTEDYIDSIDISTENYSIN